MPVVLSKGTKYEMDGAKVEITDYERNKVYGAHFKTSRLELQIKYVTEDNAVKSMVSYRPCSITGSLRWALEKN